MLDSIKQYELNDNVNMDLLRLLNFRFENKNETIIARRASNLAEEIFLSIKIVIKDNIYYYESNVWDEDFGISYTPFYQSEKHFSFLDNIILEYNKQMDELCNLGLLKEKEKEKKLTLM